MQTVSNRLENNRKMKVLIIGHLGLLGHALMHTEHGAEVHGLDLPDLDIRNFPQLQNHLKQVSPDWIVLTAAYTDVDGCESNQDRAFAVNRDGAINVARAAKEAQSRLLFLSTDYVFDGRKTSPYEVDDPRNPQSVYGRSKAEAELGLLGVLPECCIVRTSWMFGVSGKSFPDTILKLAASRPALDVVSDQRGCPTYSVDLARAIFQLCHKNATGILHATNTEDCSWFEFAREIIAGAGLTTEVRPVSSDQMARPAPRPAYSVLSSKSLQRYGVEMPTWKDALLRYLKERKT